MGRFPRTLVITSCSDLKTQPKDCGVDTRALQKQIRDKLKAIQGPESHLRTLCRKIQELRSEAMKQVAERRSLTEEESTVEIERLFQEHARTLIEEAQRLDEELQPKRLALQQLRSELGHYMLLEEDFRDPERLAAREGTMTEYMCPAAEMYAGPHHEDVMKGIKTLREHFGPDCVDLKIISAGYGLLEEDRVIAPYDITFTGMDGDRLDEWAEVLRIHRHIEEAIRPYDLVIFLLGKEYLRSVHLPVMFEKKRQRLVFVASASSLPFVNYDEEYGMVMVGNREVHDFGTAAVSLKGRVFRLFAEAVSKLGWSTMESLHRRPTTLLDTIGDARKSVTETDSAPSPQQTTLFDRKLEAPNKSFPMTFFMPENEDRVDPSCDPWTLVPEERKEVSDKQRADRYVYEEELLQEAPFDGLLVSLHEISTWASAKQQRIYEVGAREYLRYSHSGPILGDCGAFTFNDHGEPPFTSAEILERYRKLGVDMGVSVDYIIFPDLWRTDPGEAARRFQKNLEEAERFWQAWQQARVDHPDWRFTPIGVAQGGTPEKFAEAVRKLQSIGYRYIALGGLARSPASVIQPCLEAVAPEVLPDTQIHLFGFAKLELAPKFRELGVTSFDSTSPLVQGFMRGVYWDPRSDFLGTQYAAIRVPFSDGRTATRKSGQTLRDLRDSRRLEGKALEALKVYDADASWENYQAARDALVAYSQFLQPWPYDGHVWASMETLRARPWKHCDCKICREWGIAVAILRSNNHNRRRGFHNTWVFYGHKNTIVGPGMKLTP